LLFALVVPQLWSRRLFCVTKLNIPSIDLISHYTHLLHLLLFCRSLSTYIDDFPNGHGQADNCWLADLNYNRCSFFSYTIPTTIIPVNISMRCKGLGCFLESWFFYFQLLNMVNLLTTIIHLYFFLAYRLMSSFCCMCHHILIKMLYKSTLSEPINEHDAAFINWYHETNLNHLSNLSIASCSVLLHGCSISNLFTCQF
jgi:hypothetical protein